MERLFHVGFMFPGVPKIRDLEADFGALGDWIRYSQSGWLLWSSRNSSEIMRSLSLAIDESDLIVVSLIDNKGGSFSAQMPSWIWDWVKSKIPGVQTVADNPNMFDGLPVPTRPR